MNYIFSGEEFTKVCQAMDDAITYLKDEGDMLLDETTRMCKACKENTSDRLAADKKCVEDYISSFEFIHEYTEVKIPWYSRLFGAKNKWVEYDLHVSGWDKLFCSIDGVIRSPPVEGIYSIKNDYTSSLAFEIPVNVEVDKNKLPKPTRNITIASNLISKTIQVYTDHCKEDEFKASLWAEYNNNQARITTLQDIKGTIDKASEAGNPVSSLVLSKSDVDLICDYTKINLIGLTTK